MTSKNAVTRKLFSWSEAKQELFSEKLDSMKSDDSYSEDMMDRVTIEDVPESDEVLLTDLETGDQVVASVKEDELMFSELVSPEDAPAPGAPMDSIENISATVVVGDTVFFKVLEKVCSGEVKSIDTDHNITVQVDPACGLDLNVISLDPKRVFKEESKVMSKAKKTFNEDVQQMNSSSTNDPAKDEVTNEELETEVPEEVPTMVATAPSSDTLETTTEVIAEVPEEVASTALDPEVAPVVTNPGTNPDEQPLSEPVSILTDEEIKTFSEEDSDEEMVKTYGESCGSSNGMKVYTDGDMKFYMDEDGDKVEVEDEDLDDEDDALDLMELDEDDMPAPALDPMTNDEELEEGLKTFSNTRMNLSKDPVAGLFRK